MRIRLLGTGTPTPSLRRMSSGYVIETGRIVMNGPGRELLNDQRVRSAYLGV